MDKSQTKIIEIWEPEFKELLELKGFSQEIIERIFHELLSQGCIRFTLDLSSHSETAIVPLLIVCEVEENISELNNFYSINRSGMVLRKLS